MKRTVCMIAALAAAMTFAAEARKTMNIGLGESNSYELKFVPKNYRFLDKELVTVNLAPGSKTVSITAGKTPGPCRIQFNNAAGGEGMVLVVNILTEMDALVNDLQTNWLTDFDEVDCIAGQKGVTLRGTVPTPAQYEELKKICSLPDFKGKVSCDLVKLRLDSKAIAKLRKDFEDSGIKLAESGARPEPGELGFAYGDDGLSLNGTFYSEADRQKVLSVLLRQSWMGGHASTNMLAGNNFFIKEPIPVKGSLGIDDALLEVSVAFLLVSRREMREMGSEAKLKMRGVWSGFWDFLTFGRGGSRHHDSSYFRVNASLNSTLEMMAGETYVRDKQTGHFVFHANGTPVSGEDGMMRIGGTLKYTPPASGEGEAPQPQDFEYGYKVINRGCRRVSADAAELVVKVDVDAEPKVEPSKAGGSEIRQEKISFPLSAVTCEFGQTIAVTGFGNTREKTKEPTGTPLFRHIPIMNWFVAKEEHTLDDQDMLVLLSVHKVGAESEPQVGNDRMKDITYDANRPNAERIKEEKQELRNKRGGCTPLTWFRW